VSYSRAATFNGKSGDRQFRLYREFTTCSLHRLYTIEHEIHQCLLQLHTVRHDRGEALCKLGANLYCMPIRLLGHHDDHLLNHLVQVDHLQLRGTFLEKQSDAIDDLGCTSGVLYRFLSSFPRFGQIRLIAID
jgi:hypothetical protein